MFLRVGARRAGVVLAALMLLATPAAAQRSAAESIADKFSADDAAAQRKAEEQRKKEAEAKAMQALREQARKRAEEALKAERARHKPAPPPAAPQAPAATQAAAPVPTDPKVEESEMLARARQEEADRVKAQQEAEASRTIEKIIAERAAKSEEAARAKAVADARRTWQRHAQRIAAHEREVAEAEARAKAVAEAQARAKTIADARRTWQRSAQRVAAHEREVAEADDRAKALAEAEARAKALAEAARVEAERTAAAATQVPPPPPAAEATRAPTPAGSDALRSRVTVLLIMQPGEKGIRRHNKSADPILCVNGGCYVSRGAEAPAQFMPGRQALGLANTWGGRAGACRNQLGCVFRSVAVADLPLLIQPVDLRVVKHDRRHMAAVSTDSHCRLDAGRLACARGIIEDDYVMWVIPEALAETAGPAVLDRAVTAGLSGPQSAHVGVKN